jgi:hypothetical protein
MGGACNTHDRDEICKNNSGRKNQKGRNHSEVLGVDGKIILEWMLGK